MADTPPVKAGRILIVDDNEDELLVLRTMLEAEGFTDVHGETDARRMLSTHVPPAGLFIVDLHMPSMDGIQLLRNLRSIGVTAEVPVIVLTADSSREARIRALTAGANDFLTKPVDPIELVLRVSGLLENALLRSRLAEANATLEEKVRERTVDLREAVKKLTNAEAATRRATEETVRHLSAAAEFRDAVTGSHIERMGRYAELIARKAGLDAAEAHTIRLAASMHDVGKIGVLDRTLRKTGPLKQDEFEEMKTHTVIGRRILSGSDTELLQKAAMIAHSHHERFDGTGYPQGLVGDAIPFEGRMAAVADVFDSLTSDRPYRKAFPLEQALSMMSDGRGRHFDPDLLDVFLASRNEALHIYQEAM